MAYRLTQWDDADDCSSLSDSSGTDLWCEEDLEDVDTRLDVNDQTGKFTKEKNNRITVKRHTRRMGKISSLTVKTCTRKPDGKRAWDKKHYCLYCGKSQSKVSRHLERVHIEIKDVAYAFSFPLGSTERKVRLEQLRSKGDYKHNFQVLKEGQGQIVTWKQPSDEVSVSDYLPCYHCFAMFNRKDLWRHVASCRIKNLSELKDTDVKRQLQSRAVWLFPVVVISDGCQTIIDSMRQDDVSFEVRSDPLICKYGGYLYAQYGRVKPRHQFIAQRMRELGQFMLAAKDMDKTVRGLEDLCVGSRFKFVVSVIKRLAGFCPSKHEYRKPSKVVAIRLCLKGAVQLLIDEALSSIDDLVLKRAEGFFELLDRFWHIFVPAHQTLQEKRSNKEDDIPPTKNVMALRDHLKKVKDKGKGGLMAYKGEIPTSTFHTVPQEEDEKGREADKEVELPLQCSKDESLDKDDPNVGEILERPSKKKKAVKLRKGVIVKGQNLGGESLEKTLTEKKSEKKPDRWEKATGRTCDLPPPKKRPQSCDEDGLSDVEDHRPSKKKRGESSKEVTEKGRGPEPCREDERSDVQEAAKTQVKRPWSEAEKRAVHKHLGKFLEERMVPRKVHCMQCKEKEKPLDQRSWRDVKNFVYNTIVTLNRRDAAQRF